MPRNGDPATLAAFASPNVLPIIFVQLVFASETVYACTLPAPYVWAGQTWQGTGDFGEVGSISESVDVNAQGTSVRLSGINASLIHEAIADVQIGAPAYVYLGALNPDLSLKGAPLCMFGGCIDKPSISMDARSGTITMALESKMVKLGRGQNRRYTSVDQRLKYPDDVAMAWIEALNDLALKYGH